MKFACPRCSSRQYTTWGPTHLLIRHWILNPGIAVNELVLGQRMPEVMYICRDCPQPLAYRTYIVCPCCHAHHVSMLWSGQHSIGHWFGLVCPDCGEPIACVQNLTSRTLAWLTAPLWRKAAERA